MASSWYKNKKVLIVGGSKGIGESIAYQLASEGADVVVAARGQKDLDICLKGMQEKGGNNQIFAAIQMDVTDLNSVNSGTQQALAEMKGLDILICNSGFAQTGTLNDLSHEEIRRMMDVNFMGHVNVTKALLPHFIEQKHGNIALASSMLGFFSMYGWTGYSASKFAVWGMAQALRQEMLLHNVDVSVHFFPSTDTPGFELENKDKDPIVWTMETESSLSKIFKPSEVASKTLDAIRKKRFENVIGWTSSLIKTVDRHWSGLFRTLVDGDLKNAIKKKDKQKV
ncbi:MAG: SDR family NAD(P)-dependent oxidoreductase [Saprospiraceae bacterium]|nr:SDR family NAD(P)-dependent oxidoreductase [Saprospiraceae bacterium]